MDKNLSSMDKSRNKITKPSDTAKLISERNSRKPKEADKASDCANGVCSVNWKPDINNRSLALGQ